MPEWVVPCKRRRRGSGAVPWSLAPDHTGDATEATGEIGLCGVDERSALIAVQRHRDAARQRQHPADHRTAAHVVEVDHIASTLPTLLAPIGVRRQKCGDERGQDLAEPLEGKRGPGVWSGDS